MTLQGLALLLLLCSSELRPLHVAGSGAQAWLHARGQKLGAPAEPISSCCLMLPPRSRAATALLQVTQTGLHGYGTFPTLGSPAELPPLQVLCSPNNGPGRSPIAARVGAWDATLPPRPPPGRQHG